MGALSGFRRATHGPDAGGCRRDPSAAKGRDASRHAGRAFGFTLVEVLVVVVLIGIATAAGLTLLSPPADDLDATARRLAGRLDRLAMDARLSGRDAGWRCIDAGAIAFELSETDADGRAAWQDWPVAARQPLGAVRITEAEREGLPLDCARRTVMPAWGLADEFALVLHDASGATRRVRGDVFGRVTVADAGGRSGTP